MNPSTPPSSPSPGYLMYLLERAVDAAVTFRETSDLEGEEWDAEAKRLDDAVEACRKSLRAVWGE